MFLGEDRMFDRPSVGSA